MLDLKFVARQGPCNAFTSTFSSLGYGHSGIGAGSVSKGDPRNFERWDEPSRCSEPGRLPCNQLETGGGENRSLDPVHEELEGVITGATDE